MYINRLYYNADGDNIRIDLIEIALSSPILDPNTINVSKDKGLHMRFGPQTVRSTILASGSSSAAGSRVVARIEIFGDFTSYDTSGPPYDIAWAKKTMGSGQEIKFDMSALPGNGDSV